MLIILSIYRLRFITIGATIAWIGVGVMFGIFYEKYDLYMAIYFSLDAMMLSGTLPPPCVEVEVEMGDASSSSSVECALGTTRALFMSVYLVIGRYSLCVCVCRDALF